MKRLALLVLLCATPTLAQQQPDPAFMAKAITALQAQRDAANNNAAAAEARAALLTEEVASLKAKLQEAAKPPEKKGD